MARRAQNGPTFSKAPPKKRRPLTDAELAQLQARKDVELQEQKEKAAESRRFFQLWSKDPLLALGLRSFTVIPPKPESELKIKRRKI
jgi:hypothetical protein